jgi:hypothetical protein
MPAEGELVTANQDKSKPEQDRPKLEKETLRDLDLDLGAAEAVRGGAAKLSKDCVVAGGGANPGEGS